MIPHLAELFCAFSAMNQAKSALFPEDFGTRLRWFRNDRKITQADLGKTVGRTATSISEWEKGLSEPSLAQIGALAEALGVSSSRLAFGTIGDDSPVERAADGRSAAPAGNEAVRLELRRLLDRTLSAAGDDRDRLGWIKVQLETHVSAPPSWSTLEQSNARADELLRRHYELDREAAAARRQA